MKLKHLLISVLIFALLMPIFTVFPSAQGENWMFIHGENTLRKTDSAVIYFGNDSIILNSRGHDVVIDGEGYVTEIFEGTIGDDRIIDIPEGGAVVSASGSANGWLKSNVKKNSRLFYDRLSSRLFLCDSKGVYDPYLTKEFKIEAIGTNYRITPENEDDVSSKYFYSVTVNAEGVIVSTESGYPLPEGGYTVSAVTVKDFEALRTSAIIGGKCILSDNKAVISYTKECMKATANIAFDNAKAVIDKAITDFEYIDSDKATLLISTAEQVLKSNWNYTALAAFVYDLEKSVSEVCAPKKSSEMRGAFHTPEETGEAQVRSVVKAAKSAGLNTLILRTPNTIGTFIPLPESFPFRADDKFGGFDLLEAYIRICKEEEIELALCIEVYYNKYASSANEEWLAINEDINTGSKAESTLQGKYFSPYSEGFKEYFLSYVEYIARNYPIKNIMFDYLRYPKFSDGGDLGYDNATMTAFSQHIKKPINEVYKIKTEKFNSPYWKDWVQFRTGLINGMAEAISNKIRAVNSDIVLTAIAARDSVDYYYMQEPELWLEKGWMDGICISLFEGDASENDPLPPMGYYGNMVAEKLELFSAHTSDEFLLFAGLDSSASFPAKTISKAISDVRNSNADGFIFSNLSDYLAQNYYNSFKNGIFSQETLSPFGDIKDTMKQILSFAKERINNHLLPNGGCDSDVALNAIGIIDEYLALLEENVLTPEEAGELKNKLSVCMSYSSGKGAVLEDITSVCKLSLIAHKEIVQQPDTPPDIENDLPVVEDTTSKEESVPSEESVSTEDTSASAGIQTDEKKDVPIGEILIYVFLAIAVGSAVALMVIATKRNKKRSKVNRHMSNDKKNNEN